MLAFALLIIGGYLIEDQFTNPLASQSIGLFAAAVVLASALILLYELIELPRSIWNGELRLGHYCKDGHPPKPRTTPTPAVSASGGGLSSSAAAWNSAQLRLEHRTNLPYQRCYVDRVRVRG
jgi:hypothetical protein